MDKVRGHPTYIVVILDPVGESVPLFLIAEYAITEFSIKVGDVRVRELGFP